MILKGYKYRIRPNKEQEIFINKSFGCNRFVYNWGLDLKIKEYQQNDKKLSYFDLVNKLPKLKEENEWLKEVDSQSLQYSLHHLDNSFTKFFREKKSFPRFKSKHRSKQSFSSYVRKIDFKKQLLTIAKIENIPIIISREFEGKIKEVVISKKPTGKYFASILVETLENLPKKKLIKKETAIGVDVGLKLFLVASNGLKIDNPKFLKKSLAKLKKERRRLSKKKKGSNNRNKHRLKLAKIHLKIANQRRDFLHKLTYYLTHKKQVGSIVIEDLAVSNMIKNHCLAQAISDVGWGEFRRQLDYKCKWYGKNLIVISRFAPSSKLCPECGQLNQNLTLADREWTCDCGAIHDRDLLAANNIKNFGIEQYRRNYGNLNACGDDLDVTSLMKQETLTFRWE